MGNAVGSIICDTGLILGLWARDMNTLYTWIKAGGILIVLPGLLALPFRGKITGYAINRREWADREARDE